MEHLEADAMIYDRIQHLWDDQADLNKLFRPDGPPLNDEARTALVKEMSLHLISEVNSLLTATGAWKLHRREMVRYNPTLIGIELADIGKYWITLCQTYGLSPEDMFQKMMAKSMVVRQRHTEEWVIELNRPSVVVDIDNVLGDYVKGFTFWLVKAGLLPMGKAEELIDSGEWIGASSLGMTDAAYARVRHAFRAGEGFQCLPVMPGARGFLDWCRERWQIILLTSRPIHEYPNIHGDTIMWLNQHNLVYDRIWWAKDKADMLMDRDMLSQVVFAVDDERRYVEHLAEAGIRTFWFTPKESRFTPENVTIVNSFAAIIALLESAHVE
jgi:hypothetical protein